MSVDIWYLYVLKCSDGTLYTGISTDPERRLEEHNNSSRGAKYTRARRPVGDMVLLGNYTNKSDALKAENKFKKLSRQEKIMHIREGGM